MNTRAPETPEEEDAVERAVEFVNELRNIFDRYQVDMIGLLARMPSGHMLTLGEAADEIQAQGIEAIYANSRGPIDPGELN